MHTHDNRHSVILGQATTGRVITAAAAIMICVFAAFVFGGQRVIAEFGIGLAVAVFLDAFILRTVLVPAADAPLRAEPTGGCPRRWTGACRISRWSRRRTRKRRPPRAAPHGSSSLSCKHARRGQRGSIRSSGLFVVAPARVEGQPSAVVAAVLTPRVRALEDRSAGWVGAGAGGAGSARPATLACLRAEAIVDGAPRGGVVCREDRGAARRDTDAAAPEALHLAGRSGAAHQDRRADSPASLAGGWGVVACQRARLRCIMSPSQGRRAGTAPWGKADVIGDGRRARGPSVRRYELNSKLTRAAGLGLKAASSRTDRPCRRSFAGCRPRRPPSHGSGSGRASSVLSRRPDATCVR